MTTNLSTKVSKFRMIPLIKICAIFFALLFIITTYHFARERLQSQPVSWSPQWNVGDTYSVELVKDVTHTHKDKTTTYKSCTPINITVLEKNSASYTINWIRGKSDIRGVPQYPITLGLENISEGILMEVVTDISGVPQDLKNIDDVCRKIKIAADKLEKSLTNNSHPELSDTTVRLLLEKFKNNDAIKQHLLYELRQFFYYSSGNHIIGKAEKGTGTLPNPLQGPPLPCWYSTTLKQHGESAQYVSMETQLVVDKEKASEIIFKTINKSSQTKKSLPEDQALPLIDISETTSCLIDTTKGWPIKLEISKIKKIGSAIDSIQTTFTTNSKGSD